MTGTLCGYTEAECGKATKIAGLCQQHFDIEVERRGLDLPLPKWSTLRVAECRRCEVALPIPRNKGTHYCKECAHWWRAIQKRNSLKEGTTPCSHGDCERPSQQGTLCPMHYQRRRKGSDMDAPARTVGPRGGGYITPQGYRKISVNGKTVAEHRDVMERVLGRPLSEFENVHHINGVRHDNRPENLELWVKPQPSGQRVSDLVAWVCEQYPEMVSDHLGSPQLRLVVGQ